MKLTIPVYSSDRFTWKGKQGCADASDFGNAPVAEQVYDDACDVGFYVVSAKTGVRMLFTFANDKAGTWVFSSGDFTILIFND
jgi:hypothetical protein